jgi:NitT/TauT family transport system substrate-binding protein
MSKGLKSPSIVLAALLMAGSLLSFGCKEDKKAASKPGTLAKIVVADAKTTHHLNLYVAKELGLFEKHNLDVQITPVDDNAAARDLVVSGGADVFWSCPTLAIAAIANGAPIKIISQVKKPCTSVLVVKQSSQISRLEDLNSKNIAGISPTCEAVISLNVAAKNSGARFNLQRLAGGPAISALESGTVDGAILEEPHVSIAELAGHKVLFPDVSAGIPCRTINASNNLLASNADALKRFIQAIDEANKIIIADPIADSVVTIAVKYTGAPESAIAHGNHRLKFDTRIAVDGLIALGNELIADNNIKENPGEKLFADEFKGITW